MGLSGELTGDDVLLLNGSHIILDSLVDLSVEFALLAHLLQDLMLVGSLRVLKCQVAITLFKTKSGQKITLTSDVMVLHDLR